MPISMATEEKLKPAEELRVENLGFFFIIMKRTVLSNIFEETPEGKRMQNSVQQLRRDEKAGRMHDHLTTHLERTTSSFNNTEYMNLN